MAVVCAHLVREENGGKRSSTRHPVRQTIGRNGVALWTKATNPNKAAANWPEELELAMAVASPRASANQHTK